MPRFHPLTFPGILMRRSAVAVLLAALVASFIALTSTAAVAAPPAPTTSEPAPVPGENITYTGNIGTSGPRTVIVQKEYKLQWFSYDQSQTEADGDYSVEVGTTATSPRTFRIYAPAENGLEAVASDTFVLETVEPDAPTTTDPDPAPGEAATYTGNIGTDGPRTVTVEKEYKGTWSAQVSRQTEADGDYSVPVTNAALVPRTFRITAPASGDYGALTTKTFVVKVDVPDAPTTSDPQPFAGQTVTYIGNIGTTDPRTVNLQKLYKSTWSTVDTATTSATGEYSVDASNIASTPRTYRVVAPAVNGKSSVTTAEFVIAPQKDTLALSIYRVGSDVRPTGLADPVLPGRLFALQYKSGTTYKQIGEKVAADAAGKITVNAPVSGDRTYRLVGDAPAPGASSVFSNSVTFHQGPSNLGKNVIFVTTDSGTTPVTKGVDYPGTATVVSGSEASSPLDLETIAVRGNSSADKPKKPYKLKFEDKQKPFGMKSDKTWILLANYGDWSLIRSKVAWDVGGQLDGLKWTPRSTFTEVYVNGWYKGSYQLVESIKIDSNRVNVNKETGQVIEFDPHYKEDGVPGFRSPIGLDYAWKDPDEFKFDDEDEPDPEGLTTDKIAKMKSKILNFEKVLYGPPGDRRDWHTDFDDVSPEDDWTTYLDMNSAVDYYLAREFTKDNDADMYRSNFFYTNNVDPASADKFFMGPIWDFDRSAGAKHPSDTSVDLPTGWWMRGQGSSSHNTNTIHWFTRITDDPRFLNALHDRWAAKKNVFQDVWTPVAPNVNSGVYRAVAALGGSDTASGFQVAANDRAKWGSYGSRYHARTSSYPAEVAWVRNWYEDRFDWMNKELIKEPPPLS